MSTRTRAFLKRHASQPSPAKPSPSPSTSTRDVEGAPTFTEREWRCVAWMTASIAWIPNAWATEIRSISRKLRTYLGDEAMKENAR